MGEKVKIWSDGACSGNPGPGGWGAILVFGEKQKELCGGAKLTTNNQMELTAAIEALNALKRPCEIEFFTDSTYVRNGITLWIDGWIKKDWMTAAKKPVKNVELWKKLVQAVAIHSVNWNWVKGHAGNPMNERADELARQGMKPFQ